MTTRFVPSSALPHCNWMRLGAEVWALHQYLIGLRRRHPWLHAASTTAVRLDNRHYVYETRCGDDALLVALNIDDKPLRLAVSELGTTRASRSSADRRRRRRRSSTRWSSSRTAGGS